jgi:hypothetical protein
MCDIYRSFYIMYNSSPSTADLRYKFQSILLSYNPVSSPYYHFLWPPFHCKWPRYQIPSAVIGYTPLVLLSEHFSYPVLLWTIDGFIRYPEQERERCVEPVPTKCNYLETHHLPGDRKKFMVLGVSILTTWYEGYRFSMGAADTVEIGVSSQ